MRIRDKVAQARRLTRCRRGVLTCLHQRRKLRDLMRLHKLVLEVLMHVSLHYLMLLWNRFTCLTRRSDKRAPDLLGGMGTHSCGLNMRRGLLTAFPAQSEAALLCFQPCKSVGRIAHRG